MTQGVEWGSIVEKVVARKARGGNIAGSVRWLPLSLRDISLKEGDKDFSVHYLF